MRSEEIGGAEVRFEDRDGYLYVFVSGDHDSFEVSRRYWQRAIDECYRRGHKRLLVEEEFPNQATTLEMFTLVSAVAEMLTAPLKIAFVDRKTDQQELNLFGENVAVNRGIYCRTFATAADAEAWLESSRR